MEEGNFQGNQFKQITVLSLGAGVQSSTMLLMALHGEFIEKPQCAIFADTGCEPREVYQYLNWLELEAKKYDFPILRCNNGNLQDDLLNTIQGKTTRFANPPFYVKTDHGAPSILRRYCTQDYKIDVIIKAIREELIGLRYKQRVPKNVRVTQWFGISTDEITRVKSSRHSWITNQYPLIEKEMTRDDCLAWLKDRGYPLPPKSSCFFCPYHSDKTWRRIKEQLPSEWDQIVELDRKIRNGFSKIRGELYLHRSLQPIDTIDFGEFLKDNSSFENECDGVCGV
ncbi:hypothetical protein [Cohnella boryungensis]|uniref:Phosphoadenosine phosphosulphate reductase domain-containing protein n=1 Tax=Cohnella boryungensis TaxID=768479 RepID=A0ABV8SHD9_9BACL